MQLNLLGTDFAQQMSVVVLVGEVQKMQLQLSSVVIEPSAGGVLQGSDQIRSDPVTTFHYRSALP
jgi:hypothetical protein